MLSTQGSSQPCSLPCAEGGAQTAKLLLAKYQEQTWLELDPSFHAEDLGPLSKLSYFPVPQFHLLSMGMVVITLAEMRYNHMCKPEGLQLYLMMDAILGFLEV